MLYTSLAPVGVCYGSLVAEAEQKALRDLYDMAQMMLLNNCTC